MSPPKRPHLILTRATFDGRDVLRIESTWNARHLIALDAAEVAELACELKRVYPEHFEDLEVGDPRCEYSWCKYRALPGFDLCRLHFNEPPRVAKEGL